MNLTKAVAQRIQQLCNGTNINALAEKAKVPPSTIYSIFNGKSKNPGILTINAICQGLNISITEFFNCKLFDNS